MACRCSSSVRAPRPARLDQLAPQGPQGEASQQGPPDLLASAAHPDRKDLLVQLGRPVLPARRVRPARKDPLVLPDRPGLPVLRVIRVPRQLLASLRERKP